MQSSIVTTFHSAVHFCSMVHIAGLIVFPHTHSHTPAHTHTVIHTQMHTHTHAQSYTLTLTQIQISKKF